MARATAAIGAPSVCACCRSGSSPFAGLSSFAELGGGPDGIADCCARAASDHVSVLATSVAPKHLMNCRRFMSVAQPRRTILYHIAPAITQAYKHLKTLRRQVVPSEF